MNQEVMLRDVVVPGSQTKIIALNASVPRSIIERVVVDGSIKERFAAEGSVKERIVVEGSVKERVVVEGTCVTVSLDNTDMLVGAVAVVNYNEVIARCVCGSLLIEPKAGTGSAKVFTNSAVPLDLMRAFGFPTGEALCHWLTLSVKSDPPKIAKNSVPVAPLVTVG